MRAEIEHSIQREADLATDLQRETEARKETQRKLDKYRRARIRDAKTSKTVRGNVGVGAGRDVEALLASELQRRLEAEQRSRAASEQWLAAELRTREDMEGLFVALRDIAMKKPGPDADVQLKAVRGELSTLRAEKERETKARREAFDATQSRLVEDNRRLVAELSDVRATISDRLNKSARAGAQTHASPQPDRGIPSGWQRHVVAPPLATVVPPGRAVGRPPR